MLVLTNLLRQCYNAIQLRPYQLSPKAPEKQQFQKFSFKYCNHFDRGNDRISSELDASLECQKRQEAVLSPRLLHFGYSLYFLVLDLSLATQFQKYTRFPCKNYRMLYLQPCQCLCLNTSTIKILLPCYLQLF